MEGYIVCGWIGVFFFAALVSGSLAYNCEPREPAKHILCGVLAIACLAVGLWCFSRAQDMQPTTGPSVMAIEQGKTE